MKYRYLGEPDKLLPNVEHNGIYNLIVITAFWSHKPRIVKPFYFPYESWLAFYHYWRPLTMETVRLENKGLDKRKK